MAPPSRGLKTENTLWVLAPALAATWLPEANQGLLPEDVHGGSNRPLAFSCSLCARPYQATPANKRRAGTLTCGPCGRLAAGVKNARPRGQTVADRPELLALWSHELNALPPQEVALKSNKKAWWRCPEGHLTEAVVANRARGRGCGVCQEGRFYSRGEKEVLAFLQGAYPGPILANDRTFNPPYETDVVLPTLAWGLDFNGTYWHSEVVLRRKKGMSAAAWHGLRRSAVRARGGELYYLWEDDWSQRRGEAEAALLALLAGRGVHEMLRRLA